MAGSDTPSGENAKKRDRASGSDRRHREKGASFGEGEAEGLLSAIIDNAPVPVFIKSTDGTYLYANASYEKASGMSRGEVLGRTDFDVYPSDLAATYRESDLAAMRTSAPVQSDVPVFLDGEERTFSTVKFPVVNDRDQVLGICGMAVDISDSLHAEHARGVERQRAVSEELFARLLDDLTPQEVRVLNLLAEGLSDAEIAERLSLTSGTVRHHVSHLLKKLRKRSRTQAVVEMLRHRRS